MNTIHGKGTYPFTAEGMESHAREIILPYWEKYAKDISTGGFYGSIDNDNQPDAEASRSVVMTARHLWAYSAAARQLCNPAYLDMADYAYNAIVNSFLDTAYGGVFWSVKPDGTPDVEKKQIYGEAFTIYGLSEYAATLVEFNREKSIATEAISTATNLYSLLEKYAMESEFGGYVEARARDWSETSDLKLSPKDIDCCKSMNTNLHVMEAYTNLYRTLRLVLPEQMDLQKQVAQSLSRLVRTTVQRILNENNHLSLYFERDWSAIGNIISYGHDIEASWLLQEATEELADAKLEEEIRSAVLALADASLAEGFDTQNGGLYNELESDTLDKNRIWWVQAEAVTGFYNAYQMTGDKKYLAASQMTWEWICQKQVDYAGGDWFAEVTPAGTPVLSQDKGGNWKTAYHNARACLEMMRRMKKHASSQT